MEAESNELCINIRLGFNIKLKQLQYHVNSCHIEKQNSYFFLVLIDLAVPKYLLTIQTRRKSLNCVYHSFSLPSPGVTWYNT